MLCAQCQGHWVAADVLREMTEARIVPRRPVDIELVPEQRPPLACPTCEKPMETWTLHGVAIDRCDGHGLWFDRTESCRLCCTRRAGHRIVALLTPAEHDVNALIDVWQVVTGEVRR